MNIDEAIICLQRLETSVARREAEVQRLADQLDEADELLHQKEDNLQVRIYCWISPHSVATCIGCVTRDQKVPGLNPVWVAAVWAYTSGA